MRDKHVLEADSISKIFNGKTILSDVWLQCNTGDVIGLLGRNGSGKSTLLKILFGTLAADFCFLKIDGKKLDGVGDRLKYISYLPQDNFIPKHFSVETAIRLTQTKDYFNDDEFIKQCFGKKIRELSAGELRYLEITLLLSNESKFVLLDEPFSGLSPILAERISRNIKNCTHKGIIVTDHQYENIIAVSNKLILMRDGKANHIKSSRELLDYGYLPKID